MAELSILLVDDDENSRQLLSDWLGAAGYRVRCAGDGQLAKLEIEKDPPNVLIAKWDMPHVTGLDLCGWLRKQNLPAHVFTILLRSCDASDDLVKGIEAGADDFLRQPVDQNELMARLCSASRLLDMEARLTRLAKCDPLTELPTQRTFYEYMQREWARSIRYHVPMSCVMVDIDFFKRINDTHGHPVGDEVIRRVGAALSECCRASDVVSRYGGEEFCVLLPETTEQNAVLWSDRVREAIANATIESGDRAVRVTASFGVAERLVDTQSPEELVDLADQALLVAKRAGRDRVVGFQSLTDSPEINPASGGPGAIFGGLTAQNVMTTIVAALNQNDLVGRAVNYFLRFRINSAPVVDEEGKLVGILAERDVMSIMLGPNWWDTKIQEVMKKNVVCYDEDTPVLAIYEFLCRVSIRGVIIVKDGRPTGVISRGSLLRWFTNSRSVGTLGAAGHPVSENIESSQADQRQQNPLECLANTAQALAEEATEVQRRLLCDNVDVVPCVVGGASRMQELVNDLLAYSRYAGDTATDVDSRFNDVQQGLAGVLAESFSENLMGDDD